MPDAVGIIGAGLIGASIVARASAVWPGAAVLVLDRSADNAAHVAGLHPRGRAAGELAELSRCDIVFVCTPVSAIAGYVDRLLSDTDGAAPVVVDTGSVKRALVEAVRPHSNFVPGHPLAGGHVSGPSGGNPDIIDGRVFVLTPSEATGAAALDVARGALTELGARVIVVPPDLHDEALALTSHLPHLIAFALVEEFAARVAASPGPLDGLVATSFRAQTVFAASDPEMWADILIANREAIGRSVTALKERLDDFAALARRRDKESIMDRIAAIRDRRKAIGD